MKGLESHRSEVFQRNLILLVGGLGLVACASTPPRFPLRDPVWKDPDLRSVTLACRPVPTRQDPTHVSCAPEEYVSPLAWDAADNTLFRPLAQIFKVDPVGEAPNVNSVDEVPDSAWFTNRMGHRPFSLEELERGACDPKLILDGETAADGAWLIDHGKDNGASPGFRVKIPGKGKYLFKADSKEQPERPSAASVIGAAVYHAAGFNTSCEQVVYFRPSVLKLAPGLTVTNNTGITRRFDAKALEAVLGSATKRGDLVRMQASAWLPGKTIGPFEYAATRADDPNDRIPHEDRRDLRGGRLIAAWLNHFDAREQNSMNAWISFEDQRMAGPAYLQDELRERVRAAPVVFTLTLQLASPGDPVDDASVAWSDRNPEVTLGTLHLTRLADDVDESSLAFSPSALVDGIEAADPMVQARGDAYAVSAARRRP